MAEFLGGILLGATVIGLIPPVVHAWRRSRMDKVAVLRYLGQAAEFVMGYRFHVSLWLKEKSLSAMPDKPTIDLRRNPMWPLQKIQHALDDAQEAADSIDESWRQENAQIRKVFRDPNWKPRPADLPASVIQLRDAVHKHARKCSGMWFPFLWISKKEVQEATKRLDVRIKTDEERAANDPD